MNEQELPGFVRSCLRERLGETELSVLGVVALGEAADFGRASTDQKWRMIKYAPEHPDDIEGVVPIRTTHDVGDGIPRSIDLMMKARTRLGIGSGLIPETMAAVGLELGRPYPRFSTSRETVGGWLREIEVFRLQERHPALQRHLPGRLGDRVDEARNEFVLLEELITDGVLMDSADDVSGWTRVLIFAALEAIAEIHAIWYGRDGELAEMDWLEERTTTEDVAADANLWLALAEFVSERFPNEVSRDAHRRRLDIIDSIERWHPRKDAMPHTLVHDDFNPRNCGFRSGDAHASDGRPSFVVYDWELALIDLPQRDLVEMLVFTLPDSVSRAAVDALVERHRIRLQSAAEARIDRDEWFEGFRCELYLEAINRVPLQWVFHSRYPTGYAARINRTLERLLSLYADLG